MSFRDPLQGKLVYDAFGESRRPFTLTGLPLQTIRPGRRGLGKKDKMPKLPDVEYVLRMRESDTRPTVSALGNLIREMAAKATSPCCHRRSNKPD
jgi:hypothetical protein